METLQQQIMLRISAYAGMPERMVESLRNLAILTLPRDLPLGLSYLLALPEVRLGGGVLLTALLRPIKGSF